MGLLRLLQYQQNGVAKQSRLAMEIVRITMPNKLTIVFFVNNTANILSSQAIQEIFGTSNETDIADAIGNF